MLHIPIDSAMPYLYNRHWVTGSAVSPYSKGRTVGLADGPRTHTQGGGDNKMPTYPPPDNPLVVKLAMLFSRDTRNLVNTLHFRRTGGWTLPAMTQLANDAKAWWNLVYRVAVPAAVALQQIQVRLYDPSNPLAVDLPVSPAIPGTRPGLAEAANVSLTLSERTGLAGRAYRGRIYVPSLGEDDLSQQDTVGSVLVTALALAGANLVFGFTSSGGIPCIFHRPQLIPGPRDNTFNDVVSYIVENVVDSQRRRLPGRGR